MMIIAVIQSSRLLRDEAGCSRLTMSTAYMLRFLIRKVESFIHQRCVTYDAICTILLEKTGNKFISWSCVIMFYLFVVSS